MIKSGLLALCWGALLNLYAITWNSVNNFPLGAQSNGVANTFATAFDVQGEQMVTVWADAYTSAPYYSLYNGSTWSTVGVAMPLGASSGLASIAAAYNPSSQQTIAVWPDSSTFVPYYTIYNGTSWSTPYTIPLGASSGSNYSISLVFDSTSQNVVVSWADKTTKEIYYSVYNGTIWTTPGTLPLGGTSGASYVPALAPDASSGQLVAIWSDYATAAPYYSVYDGANWSTATAIPLGGSAGADNGAVLALDDNPNETIAAWADSASQMIYYSLYDGTTWNSAPLNMGASTGVANNITLAFDGVNNQMVMLWADRTNPLIYYSSWDGTSWAAPQSFSNGYGTARGIVSLAYDPTAQQMVALWNANSFGYYATSQPPPGPNPPGSATAQLLFDQYLTGTDRVHRLQWTASTDPTTVGYQISAGGTVEGTTTGTQIFLRNRVKGQLYNYSIAGYNSSGTVGQPLTVSAEG